MVYKLSATLSGHSSDVRAVASPSPTLVLSASRDATAVVWMRPDDKVPFRASGTYKASDRFVNAIAFLSPTAGAPKGYIVTGSQDGIINIYAIDSGSGDPEYTLLGHTANVCSLYVTPGGAIVSGSWDQTARVWKAFQPLYELKGHTASVLAVLALTDDEYLTASADKTIRLWDHHKQTRIFTGHTDVVRGLALIPEIGFASCSNDGDIRVWTPDGDIIYVLSGHTSFVYSVSFLPNGDLVSSGEDRTVRVWTDGECSQTIVHPAISVWTVSCMPNGDIVSGASDKEIRVFTSSEERWASEGDLKAFDDLVASHAVPTQTTGSVDKDKLPTEEALNIPGKKEGDNKLIRNAAGAVDVYTWAGGAWMKVGEMTDGVGSSEKKMHNGKEWDYVFEVDAADGAPKLLLPYNANENPYAAAQRFLAQNDLPPAYLDQVVQFIEKQTAGVNIGSSNQYVDPYTGASRYQASSTPAATGAASSYVDPYTGASRYAPPVQPVAPASSAGSYVDPYTGASRYVSPGQTPAPTPSVAPIAPTSKTILPVKTTFPFRQCNVPAMRTKFLQLNDALKGDVTTSMTSASKSEIQVFDRIFTFLQNVSTVGVTPTIASGIKWSDIDIVMQVIFRWPESQRFPLIDLMRLIAFFCPQPAGAPADAPTTLMNDLLTACHWEDQSNAMSVDAEHPAAKSRQTNTLLVLRALANALQVAPGDFIYGEGPWTDKLFVELAKVNYETLNKNQKVALATILFNYSCVALLSKSATVLQPAYMTIALKILKEETTDSETVYRTLIALGNMLSKQTSRDKSLWAVIEPLSTKFPEDRMKVLNAELKNLLRA